MIIACGEGGGAIIARRGIHGRHSSSTLRCASGFNAWPCALLPRREPLYARPRVGKLAGSKVEDVLPNKWSMFAAIVGGSFFGVIIWVGGKPRKETSFAVFSSPAALPSATWRLPRWAQALFRICCWATVLLRLRLSHGHRGGLSTCKV